MVMAGIAALHEMDIKKVVALSTLSQLGIIITRLGAGLFVIRFFHLICHAFFKALLFLTVGNIIHISNNYQDTRKVGLVNHESPITLAFAVRAILRLCGTPFISGYYSKDLCLEISVSSGQATLLLGLFYVAVGLTAAYRARLIGTLFLLSSSGRLLFSVEADARMRYSMATLWP